MNYPQALEYLYSQLPMFQRIGAAAYKADLSNTQAMIGLLGHPEKKFTSIHVAGTNGKGSVCHLLASILQEAGYRTGLFTSPHLKDFRERIRINGKMVPQRFVAHFVSAHKKTFENISPSFFEYTAVMAFEYFASEKVDFAILETGMGGRLDSTNVVNPIISVITNISMDHTAYLGNTMALIAAEKAGIIKPGIPVVIGETHEETRDIFLYKARRIQAPIVFADQHYFAEKTGSQDRATLQFSWNIRKEGKIHQEGLKCPLQGNYQAMNLVTVMQLVEELGKIEISIGDDQLKKGIERVIHNTGLMGRWHLLGEKPRIICDVGHNAAGIKFILEQLKEESFRQLHWVFGMVNDKDSEDILKMMPAQASYYFCKADVPRGKDAYELQAEAMRHGLKGSVYGSVNEAFAAARAAAGENDLVFVGGSTFVVAEVL